MINPLHIDALKRAGIGTLALLESLENQPASKIATEKIRAGKDKLRLLIAQLENPNMTDEQFHETADKLKEIGTDLIQYGSLIMPPQQNN